ncbi:MAG: hypothetical protein AAGM22_27610 [Acidobacteriota bacterium]
MTHKIRAAVILVLVAAALLTQPVAASPSASLVDWTEGFMATALAVVNWLFPQPDLVGPEVSEAPAELDDAETPELFPEPDPVG